MPDRRIAATCAGEPDSPAGSTAGAPSGLTRALLAAILAAAVVPAMAQDESKPVDEVVTDAPVDTTPSAGEQAQDTIGMDGLPANALLQVPVTGIYPGGVRPQVDLGALPVDDPAAANRGMTYFNQFNCVGCHAPNGGGGMGPALSNANFKYGGEPANVYLSILQGRPNGMPVFGGFLPDTVIWDLVAYIQSISKDDTGEWGQTISLESFSIEQVPAQYMTTVEPWKQTQPFSYGQPPFASVETPKKPE